MSNITIGLTCGDINGIGLEVILKAVAIKKAGSAFRIVVSSTGAPKSSLTTKTSSLRRTSSSTPSKAQQRRSPTG